MEVKLYKKNSSYLGSDGKEHVSTRVYAACGDRLIPIEVIFFKDKVTGEDRQFSARRALLAAFAEPLPDKPTEA